MEEITQDLKHAARTFAKSPGFTLVVVLTLALGIGANTAIFTLMDQVLLRSLPVREPERLVIVDAPGPFSGASHQHSDTLEPMSHPMFEGLRDRATSLSGVLAHFSAPVHLTAANQTDSVNGDLVSGTFFDVLGLRAPVGRLFTAEDDKTPGGHPVVVLGYGFFQRRFGGDAKIVGQGVLVNGHPMTVVGVSPAGFRGVEVGDSVDVFVPLMMQAQVIPSWQRGIGDWRVRWLTVMARLRDGVSLDEARAEVGVLYRQLLLEDAQHLETKSERFRTAFLEKQLHLLPGGRGTSALRDQSRTPLLVLMGMVGLVLLIACANVANLLLARASARQKEIALRLALGASRGRLVRQLLAESLVLSVAGGALGILFASWTGELLLRALPFDQASQVLSAQADLRVGAFALALSLATALIFGLAPAFQSTRLELAHTLKNEAASLLGGSAPFRFRKGLVVAQVALSLLLLVGAGLFTRSLMNLGALNPGFEPEHVLGFSVNPTLNDYKGERRLSVLKQILDEVAAEPGVRSVSLSDIALMANDDSSSTVQVEGYTAKDDENMNPKNANVAPGFFNTLGVRLVAGRDFSPADGPEAPKVAVVNETFARYFFGEKDPVGRHFAFAREPARLMEIVGVVKDGKAASLREDPQRFLYRPYTQAEDRGGVTFYVRTAVEPAQLGGRMRDVVRRVDPTLPVTDLKTMRAQIRESLFVERLEAALSASFGFLATVLAALGLYGVMSYAVGLRTREIGIRVALGAGRRTVLLMVMKEVAMLAGLGVALGLPGGYGLGRLLEAQLFGLTARDPMTFAVATATLLLAAGLAAYLPALRATRVEPMVALRYE
jgi:putative ABC transport system permease protein